MRETLTSLLDVLALLLLAAGVGVQVAGWPLLILRGPSYLTLALAGVGLTVSGMTVLAGSWFASRRTPEDEDDQ